ncbi:MAG: DUF61 family protein [Candidatus Thorarchaeota archaeon]|nr:DUF61 family protein [Candidatus Thorarchaeota archaeon]
MTSGIDRMLEREIESINDHMPAVRHTLKSLLLLESPKYFTRTGQESIIKKEEIQNLAKEVPSHLHEEIKLPILILRRMDYGSGIYTISGGRFDLFLVHHILGYIDLPWEEMSSWKPIEQIMRPQVQELRRRFPSATCIGFVTVVAEK